MTISEYKQKLKHEDDVLANAGANYSPIPDIYASNKDDIDRFHAYTSNNNNGVPNDNPVAELDKINAEKANIESYANIARQHLALMIKSVGEAESELKNAVKAISSASSLEDAIKWDSKKEKKIADLYKDIEAGIKKIGSASHGGSGGHYGHFGGGGSW